MCTLRGRCCVNSLKAMRERAALKLRAREASAAAARPTERRSAHACPAAAPAAGAALAAAQTNLFAQVTQHIIQMYQRGRAGGSAAAVPARSAEDGEAASMCSPAACERGIDDPAAGGLWHRTAAEDTSDGSHARGAAGSAEPAGMAGDSQRAGGSC